MKLPKIELTRLQDNRIAAHWYGNFDWKTDQPRYKGSEIGNNEFEAIAKALLKFHAANTTDGWTSIKDLPAVNLYEKAGGFVANWVYDHYGMLRFGREERSTAFEAIAYCVIKCWLSIAPVNLYPEISNELIFLKDIYEGTARWGDIPNESSNKSGDDVTVSEFDSHIIVSNMPISIKEICDGTAKYPIFKEDYVA